MIKKEAEKMKKCMYAKMKKYIFLIITIITINI